MHGGLQGFVRQPPESPQLLTSQGLWAGGWGQLFGPPLKNKVLRKLNET